MEGEHTFATLQQLAGAYTTALLSIDPTTLDGAACEGLVGVVVSVDRSNAAAKVRFARRATEANRWRASGDRTPGEWLSRQTGTTPGQARSMLELADHLAAAPATEAALAAGVVSPEQAAEVAAAARVDPAAEDRLLTAARQESLVELRRRARKVRAAGPDEHVRRERIHRDRRFRAWTDQEGAFCFAGRGLPEDGAAILAALKPHQDAAFHRARRAGLREPSEAHAYDGLLALATSRAGDGDEVVRAPAKIILSVDLAAMERGHTVTGETCEIAGVGPVSVSVARDLLGEAVLALVVTDGVDIRNVTHLGRAPTAHQRTALEARGMECEVEGCGRTTGLEIDHVDGWAITRRTQIDQLAWLCGGARGHHRQKTHEGYTLTGPPGARTWHPPPGPRPGGEPRPGIDRRAAASALPFTT